MRHRFHFSKTPLSAAALVLIARGAFAAEPEIALTGITGGLVIPSAYVLDQGALSLSLGNYREAALSPSETRKSFHLGVGVLPNVELFGRFADYQNPSKSVNGFITGPRDLSANIKWQIPFWQDTRLPKIALGFQDVNGGANFFGNSYAVLTDRYGPLQLSLGYAKRRSQVTTPYGAPAMSGAFGGLRYELPFKGFSALAEYDGHQKHAGLRYTSEPMKYMGGMQLQASLQRSFGGQNALGNQFSDNSVNFAAHIPFENLAPKTDFASIKKDKVLPEIGKENVKNPVQLATLVERQDALRRALINLGLERVRVGILEQMMPPTKGFGATASVPGQAMVIEYENRRYQHSEFDALGLVLGLAAELAPEKTAWLRVDTLKAGLRTHALTVKVSDYRQFLRGMRSNILDGSLGWEYGPAAAGAAASNVQWSQAQASMHTPLRVEIKPEFVHALGTEVGAFDYSLGLNFQGISPLWKGAELYGSYIQELTRTRNFEPNQVYGIAKIQSGLNALALQQSLWLGSLAHVNVGVGKFLNNRHGAQLDSSIFAPGLDGVIRLRGAVYSKSPTPSLDSSRQGAVTYQMALASNMSLEAGMERFRDGQAGPSVQLSRWFGDFGLHLHYRRGGNQQFAGLDFSIPLSPRQGDMPGAVSFGGNIQQRGVRTRILNSTNDLSFNGGKEIKLDYNAQQHQLNSGKISRSDVSNNLDRMREAFYTFARDQLPF